MIICLTVAVIVLVRSLNLRLVFCYDIKIILLFFSIKDVVASHLKCLAEAAEEIRCVFDDNSKIILVKSP